MILSFESFRPYASTATHVILISPFVTLAVSSRAVLAFGPATVSLPALVSNEYFSPAASPSITRVVTSTLCPAVTFSDDTSQEITGTGGRAVC
jgi:hypothetical protein